MYIMFTNCKRIFHYLTLFALVSLSIFFLSPNANATDEIDYFDNTSRISLGYRVCVDHGSYYTCDSRVSRTTILPSVYDSSTGVAQYTITPSFTTCDSYPDLDCRLVVDSFSFEIRNNSSVPTSFNFINGKVWTGHDLFFGKYPTMSGSSIWADDYNVTSSFDLSIWKSSSKSFVCGDSTPDECLFGYWQNKVVYDQTNTYNGFDFSASKDLFSSSYYEVTFRAYPYNKSTGHLDMTTSNQNNIIFDLPRTAPLVFYAQFWGSDTIYEVEDNGEGIEVSDIQQEMDKIDQNMQNAQNSADDIDIDFSVPNIVSPFFSLFTDNSCVSITNLASWLHSSETYVCSPWPSAVRDVLSPVVSFIVILLLFGFIVRWLHKNDFGEGA